jgi:hypothetical protein
MKRFPGKQEVINASLTILALIHTWALIIFLFKFPGLIKHLTYAEVFSVFSYVIVSAFFESFVSCVGLLLLAFLLPEALLRNKFAVRSSIIMLLSEIYIIPLHVYLPRLSTLIFETGVITFITLWTLLFIVELVLFSMIVSKYPGFTAKAQDIVERITVLGALYLILDVVAVLAVIFTNWS